MSAITRKRSRLAAPLAAAMTACLALAAAPAANAATCPASIAPVAGGYGHAGTGGRDDGTPGTEPLWAAGQLVISLKRSATTAELRCVARELKAEILDGDRSSDGLAGIRNTMIIQLHPGVSVAKTMRLLEQRRYESLIRYAAPNYEISYEANPTREPLYPIQWGLGNGKIVPKKSPSAARLAEMNDPNTTPERKASLEARYMSVIKFQAPFGEADRLLSPGTFAQGMTPFSIQAQRAWKKMPSVGFFDFGPSLVDVAVIDSGLANHYELDAAVDDRGRSFTLDGRAYQVTIKPGANGSYRLNGNKVGLGKFETCPISVNATAAQVETQLNRLPDLCTAPEITSVGINIDADGGTFAVRTATGRIATGIPADVEPAQLQGYLRQQLGLAAGDVEVASRGRRAGTLRTISISFSKPVYDREQFVFDGGQLKLGAGAGRLSSVVLDMDEFTVSARPANAPPAQTWAYQVDARDGNEFTLSRANAYADIIESPQQTGGVRRSRPAGKWLADPLQHGTFVAGVIAADPGNREGMTGVLNNSSVNVTGLVPTDGSATIAAAVTHAADTLNASVVNISLNWGGSRVFPNDPGYPRPKRLADADQIAPDAAADAIARVTNTRTLFVAAAGNESVNVFDDGPETDPILQRNAELRQQGRLSEITKPPFGPYPCRPKNGGRKSVLQMPDGTYDRGNIICVGSANWYGQPSEFTNWGTGVVDLAAPGEHMVGPDASDGRSFMSWDGTSFSAPVVSGIAAMIFQKFPGISEASIVKCAILSSATTRPLVIAGADFGTTWKPPFKAYADKMMLGDNPGKLPVGKRVFTVTGMAQADEALSAAGSLWSRYRSAVRKNTAKPKCVQRRAGSFWGKGKWTNAADLPPGF